MTVAYSQVINEINSLALKNGLDKLKDNYVAGFRDSILYAIEEILKINTIMQIYGDNLKVGIEYEFSIDTELSKDTIMNVYSETDEMIEQNIMMTLIRDILDEQESEVLNNLIDSYNTHLDDKFIEYIKKADLTALVKKTSPIFGIIALVKNGTNLIVAIKEVLIKNGLDPSKKEIRDSIDNPNEIKIFLTEFNELLLSKISPGKSFFITQPQSYTVN